MTHNVVFQILLKWTTVFLKLTILNFVKSRYQSSQYFVNFYIIIVSIHFICTMTPPIITENIITAKSKQNTRRGVNFPHILAFLCLDLLNFRLDLKENRAPIKTIKAVLDSRSVITNGSVMVSFRHVG